MDVSLARWHDKFKFRNCHFELHGGVSSMGGSLGVAAASSGGLGSRFDLDQQQKPKRVHKCPKSQSDSSNGVSRLIQVGHASEVMNNLCDYLISCVNRMHVTHWFCHLFAR